MADAPRRSPLLCYDHDPFAERDGRAPLRRGISLDKSKMTFIPNRQKGPTMATDTDPDAEIVSKLKDYLLDVLSPEQMDDVKAILAGQDVQAPQAAVAMDRARQRTEAEEGFLKRFPQAGRFVR